jgi:hypothetical protein
MSAFARPGPQIQNAFFKINFSSTSNLFKILSTASIIGGHL